MTIKPSYPQSSYLLFQSDPAFLVRQVGWLTGCVQFTAHWPYLYRWLSISCVSLKRSKWCHVGQLFRSSAKVSQQLYSRRIVASFTDFFPPFFPHIAANCPSKFSTESRESPSYVHTVGSCPSKFFTDVHTVDSCSSEVSSEVYTIDKYPFKFSTECRQPPMLFYTVRPLTILFFSFSFSFFTEVHSVNSSPFVFSTKDRQSSTVPYLFLLTVGKYNPRQSTQSDQSANISQDTIQTK